MVTGSQTCSSQTSAEPTSTQSPGPPTWWRRDPGERGSYGAAAIASLSMTANDIWGTAGVLWDMDGDGDSESPSAFPSTTTWAWGPS